MDVGIEIGGTKLQIGLGCGDGTLRGLWRGRVDPAQAAEGIRRQIAAAIPELLRSTGTQPGELQAVGVGFGGPVDDATRSVIKSHQIAGWEGAPLAAWLEDLLGIPAVLGNDADVAGLAEATWGAGRGLSPILYITVGSGIGGGLILNGEILRGTGRGAAEIGHLRVRDPRTPNGQLDDLENIASGWAIGRHASRVFGRPTTVEDLKRLAEQGNDAAWEILQQALEALAEAICAAIVLVCPRRVVIGGGVSLLGNDLFFQPLRRLVAERVFPPFAGLTDIQPAALGEEVVVHGALALAQQTRQQGGGRS